MEGTICDHLNDVKHFIHCAKPGYFDDASDQDLDFWVELLDTNNWDDDFFDDKAMREYVNINGDHLNGYRLNATGQYELVPYQDATHEELRWFVIHRMLRPAFIRANSLLSITEEETLNHKPKLAKILEMTNKWSPRPMVRAHAAHCS